MPNLTQLTTLKARLGIDTFELSFDTQLNNLIALVSGRFAKFCRRDFDRQASVTQEFEGDQTELVVNRYPLESVGAFHLKANETDGWELQSDVDYLIKGSASGVPCIITLSGELGANNERLRVTYTGGYVLPGTAVGAGQTALPADIDAACAEQCAFLWQRRDQLGIASVSAPQGGSFQLNPMSVIEPWDLIPAVKNLLMQYERWQL